MKGIYISHLASALGSLKQGLDAAKKANLLFSSVDALRSAGFESHHVCAEDEDSYHLAVQAFSKSGIEPLSVDAIIYSTCLPQNGCLHDGGKFSSTGDVKHLMQFPASRLQTHFGMSNAFVLGINQQACTGMLGALRLARDLLIAEESLNRIVCLSADRFPPSAKYEQAYNLISDGAAVCLVSREVQVLRLLSVHHITNGAMVDASDDQTVGAFFTYCCRLVDETLDKSGMTISDIDWVVPQNTNRKAWQILSSLLRLEPSRAYFPTMASCGHVVSADNIINLAALIDSDQLNSGDRILTFMAGYGSNWQCAVLEAV